MKDEIKEILDIERYRNKDGYVEDINLLPSEIHKILDYITNLQEENERLKKKYDNNKSHEINYKYFTTLYSKAKKDIVIDDLVYKCEDLDNLRQSYEKLYIEKEDYKSRNEKAIELIEKESWFCYKDNEEVIDRTPVEELLKILKGE